MSTYVNIPGIGSVTWKDPVDNFALLPTLGNSDGDVRVTLDTNSMYIWDETSSSWQASNSTQSFTIWQTPFGTFPTADLANDTMTLTSSDSSITITGDATTDTLDFKTSATGINSLNSLTATAQTLVTGTSGTDFNISSVTSTHTFNIPDASATNRGLITIGSQTIAGTKSFSSAPKITPFSVAGIVHNDATGLLSSSLIVNVDVAAAAAIDRSKLAAGTANHVVINDGSGNFSSEANLAISRGGTNSGTALSNNRIMVSSAGKIVEAAALTDGQLLIGSTGAAPVAASITGTTNQITVTGGAGTITLSTPQDIATTSSVTFGQIRLGASGKTNANYNIQKARVQTTDATATTIITFATTSDTGYIFKWFTAARRTDVIANTNGYERTVKCKNIGGTVTTGTFQSSYTDEDTAACNVSITTSGTSILFQVTGVAAQNWDWNAALEWVEV